MIRSRISFRVALCSAFIIAPVFLMLLRALFPAVAPIRLAIYGFPAVVGGLLLMRGVARPTRLLQPVHRLYFRPLLLLYGCLISASLLALILQGIHARFLEEAWFLLAPLASAALFFSALPARESASPYNVVLMAGFTGIYLVTSVPGIHSIVDVFRWDVFLRSSIATESGVAFVFGLLVIHFSARRNIRLAVLGFLLLLLSYKRIAIAAVLCGLGVLWLVSTARWRISHHRFKLAVLAVAVNVALVFTAIAFATGTYDRRIVEALGVSANEFTMGRRYAQNQVLTGLAIPKDWLDLATTMKGLGTTHVYMDPHLKMRVLHSDLLKALIEFGLIGFIAWIFGFYFIHALSAEILALVVYWNILWITDNTLIYFDVAFVFYLLVGLALVEKLRAPSAVARRSLRVPANLQCLRGRPDAVGV